MVDRFDTWRQRAALTDLADRGAQFLGDAEGVAFMEQLHVYFAPSIVGVARKYGYAVEPEEGVNMMIDHLLSSLERGEKSVPRRAAMADNPWGYLWGCALDWVKRQWGTRGAPLEHAEHLPASQVGGGESYLTPLEDVVALTFGLVSSVIEEQHHAAVWELLMWVAVNPPQRLSYEVEDRVAAHRHCPSLTIEQVVAVMKIARGARPRTEATSLMGQFLLDPEWRVSSSLSHARALTQFKHEFRVGETGSRMLTDWSIA